jgi:hypothetical protein
MIAVRAWVKYLRHTSKPGSNVDFIDEHGAGVRGTWKLPTYLYFPDEENICAWQNLREKDYIYRARGNSFYHHPS